MHLERGRCQRGPISSAGSAERHTWPTTALKDAKMTCLQTSVPRASARCGTQMACNVSAARMQFNLLSVPNQLLYPAALHPPPRHTHIARSQSAAYQNGVHDRSSY